jgi:arylsulfatase A-like enzyme
VIDHRQRAEAAKLRLQRVCASLIALAIIGLAPGAGAQQQKATSGATYPVVPKAPQGAPNVVLVLTDDTGFGVSSTFGGPVPTPNLDALAARGLAYTRFHTTAMCSPTRAALLTGRNHHAVATGTLTDFASGEPGYNAFIPDSAATIARVLTDNGYSTAMIGKHHNVPIGQLSDSGPFDLWPTGLGFQYFFGFNQSDTDQWHPLLVRGTSRLDDPHEGELLDKILADDAIRWLHNQQAASPDKPFFLYFATGSNHTPHQAPADWIARFRGAFADGYEAFRQQTLERQIRLGIVPPGTQLSPWPQDIPRWADLSTGEREVQQRYMEAFAGMVAYQDAQIGRVLGEIGRMGLAGNTLVIFVVGDNGADAAGSPQGAVTEVGEMANGRSSLAQRQATLDQVGSDKLQNNYSSGWALAMNAPFPHYKQIASHLGGTRNGLVISWPQQISRHGLRSQYHHLIDIVPTILTAAGVAAPEVVDGVEQQPINGLPMQYSFADPSAPSPRTTQYYEMLGNRAIYHEGWLASTTPRRLPWRMSETGPEQMRNQAGDYTWELYDLTSDFSQSHNIAAAHPERLAAMSRLFEREAARNNVLPIDDRTTPNRYGPTYAHYLRPRSRYEYWGKDISVPLEAAPNLTGRSFLIEADLAELSQGADGVIAAVGSRFGGWSFHLRGGRPAVSHVLSPVPGGAFDLVAAQPIASAKAQVRFEFVADANQPGTSGMVRISVDGQEVTKARIETTISRPGSVGETFDIGRDRGVPVTDQLARDGRLQGDVRHLVVTFAPSGPVN